MIPVGATFHFTATARKVGSVHSYREAFQPVGFLSETTDIEAQVHGQNFSCLFYYNFNKITL